MANTIFGINIYELLINLFFLAIIGSVTVFKSIGTDESGADYFLAINKGKWMTLGISIFVTIVSSEFFFYILLLKLYIGINSYAIIAAFLMAILFVIIILIPRFASTNYLTITQFFEDKFNNKYLAWVTKLLLLFYSLVKISLIVFISGLLLQEILKIDMVSCLLFIIFFAGVATLVGGLTTMASLHLIQTAGFLFTLVYFSVFGRNIFEINNFVLSIKNSLLKVSDIFFNNETSSIVVLVLLFLLGIWCWGFDQRIFQRVISANGFRQTLKTYLSGISLLGVTIFILVNYLLSDSIYSNTNLLMNPQERHMLPYENGILMMGIFGWLMSSLSTAYHSFSSHISFDVFKAFYPNAGQQELVLVARLTLTVLVLATILLVPLMKLASLSFFIYTFGFLLLIILPLCSVFICGVIFNKISTRGVYLSFIISGLVIIAKIISAAFHYAGSANYFLFFINLNFSDLALFLFLLNGTVITFSSFWENKEKKPFFADFSAGFKNCINKHEKITDLKTREIFKQI